MTRFSAFMFSHLFDDWKYYSNSYIFLKLNRNLSASDRMYSNIWTVCLQCTALKYNFVLLDIVMSKHNIKECIYVPFPCPYQKGTKLLRGKDLTFAGIKHFTPSQFDLLWIRIQCTEICNIFHCKCVCVYIYIFVCIIFFLIIPLSSLTCTKPHELCKQHCCVIGGRICVKWEELSAWH